LKNKEKRNKNKWLNNKNMPLMLINQAQTKILLNKSIEKMIYL